MLIVLPFGLAVGLTMGALGAGGSLLAIPVLVHLVGLDVHAATTASLAVVGLAALMGVIPHFRAGDVRLGAGVAFGAVGIGGAVAGSWLNRRASDDVLLLGFAGLALVVAVLMMQRIRVQPSSSEVAHTAAAWARVVAVGTVVGLLTGLFGVGGGFVVVPALILVLGFPLRDAVGTSLVVIAVNAGVALAARMPSLDLDWSVAGPFAAAGVAGVFVGTALGRRTATTRLTFALAGLLVIVAGVVGLPAAFDLARG